MTKNELIEKLQSIKGNPIILLYGESEECYLLKGVYLNKMHQSNNDSETYIEDCSYKSGSTFYLNNYKKKPKECILLTLYE